MSKQKWSFLINFVECPSMGKWSAYIKADYSGPVTLGTDVLSDKLLLEQFLLGDSVQVR